MRILEICKEKGITIADLSRKMNLSYSYLCDVAHGKRAVSENRLAEIADALQVMNWEVYGGEYYLKQKAYYDEMERLLQDRRQHRRYTM